MQSRVEAEEESEEAVPVADRIAELDSTEREDESEVIAGIEEGADVEASGESAKEEMAEATSEEAMNDA